MILMTNFIMKLLFCFDFYEKYVTKIFDIFLLVKMPNIGPSDSVIIINRGFILFVKYSTMD